MLNIYKASAGSGKTYTLTREYITLLLGQRDTTTGRWILNSEPRQAHRNILAITFTNKATDEMTARIISELAILGRRDITTDKTSPYLDYLCQLFSTDAETITKLASATLDDLLMDFAYFHVSTIDAFFQTVLRTFSREVELPDDFNLELDNSYTISLGVGEMLNSINYRESTDPVKRQQNIWLKNLLSDLMLNNLNEGKVLNLFSRKGSIRSSLIDTFTKLLDETFKINAKAITQYLGDLNRIIAFEKAVNKSCDKRCKEIAKASQKILQYGDFQYINNHIRNKLSTWATGKITELGKSGKNALDDISKRFLVGYIKKGVNPTLNDLIVDTLQAVDDAEQPLLIRERIKKPVMRMGLLGCLLVFLDNLCKDNNLILLSDTGSILRNIITDDETPFVYERIGFWLDHFLIDEFQDTSRMQWDNLRPMLMESLSRNEHDLIIGDEKQCIYRFRNSDPALLGSKVADAIDNTLGEGLTKISGERIEENTNWRSSLNVVKFNNTMFRALGHYINADNVYGSVVQRIDDRRLDNPGYVSLTLVNRDADNDSEDDLTKQEGEDSEQSSTDIETVAGGIPSVALEGMVKNISRMLDSGRQMRDIAVLVRTHNQGQQVIDRLLMLNNDSQWHHPKVEITSSDSMEISRSGAVKIIIEVLRLALTSEYINVKNVDPATGEISYKTELNPRWKQSRLNRWYNYFMNLDIDPATSLPPTQGNSLTYALTMISEPEELTAEQAQWREKFVSTYDRDINNEASLFSGPSLEIIIDRIIDNYISPNARDRDTIFLMAFQDLVLDYMERSASDIRGFIDWWDRSGCHRTLSTLPDTDAITVMTIHQSKGLEFPCVIIPSADWKMVTYNSPTQPSYGWYKIDSKYFPEINPSLVPGWLPMDNEAKLLEIPAFADDATTYRTNQQVDALNLAYVAFTRAVDELIVYAPYREKKHEDKLGSYIYDICTSPADDFLLNPDEKQRPWLFNLGNIYDSQSNTITLGEPTKVTKKANEKSTGWVFGGTFPPMLPSRLPDYRPALNLSRMVISEDDIEIFDYNDPRQKGNFIHRILSKISHPDRAAIEVRRACYRARLNKTQTEEVATLIERALANKEVQKWFTGYRRLIVERELFNKDEMIRRPDRIVWTADNHIDIIDYKTGQSDPKYYRQIKEYARRMHEAGYTNLRGYLWYVSNNIIEPVPLNLT